MTIQLINPVDLPPQATRTQIVVAAGTTTMFIAGQEPEDVHGNSVGPGDLAELFGTTSPPARSSA